MGVKPEKGGIRPHARQCSIGVMSRRRIQGLLGFGVLAVAAVCVSASAPRGVPAIVFVSRQPLDEPGVLPGLGPHHAHSAPGGRLLLRTPEGAITSLLPEGEFHDVSDPSVSPSGRWIAFAGVTHPDSGWRIWRLRSDGSELAAITHSDRALDLRSLGESVSIQRYDDVDPCWVSEDLLVFSSTRLPLRAQYADVAVANLYRVRADGSGLRRITTERNGAAEPRVEPRTGRIVYARWWFNPWRASAQDPSGITLAPAHAIPRDTVNLWQLVAIEPASLGPRLAAGAVDSRLHAMAAEAAPMPDGSWLGTYAENLGLSPGPGATGLHRLDARGRPTRRVIGALVPDSGLGAYAGTLGLASPSACSPAALPDGRIVFAWAPGARGDLGLWLARADGSRPEPIVDLRGTLELDPVPLVARRLRTLDWDRVPGFGPDADRALLAHDRASPALGSFAFECEDVFAGGGLPGVPAREPGLALRFFAMLPRLAGAIGDSVVLIRTEPVGEDGAIRARDLPAGIPLFEQLVNARGAPVETARGPAHVAGSNAGAPGQVTRCIGCHAGHSRLKTSGRP